MNLRELILKGKDRIFISPKNEICGWCLNDWDYKDCSTLDKFNNALEEFANSWKSCGWMQSTKISTRAFRQEFKSLLDVEFTEEEINASIKKNGRFEEAYSIEGYQIDFTITINLMK